MKHRKKIPTLIGVLLLIVGIASGVLLIQRSQIFKLQAASTYQPKDVRITNITESGFSASWTTDQKASCFLKWGQTSATFDRTENDEISNNFTHYVTVRGLSPSKQYYFKINCASNDFNNNAIPWQVTTGVQLDKKESTNIISGTVLTATGATASNSLVYFTIGGASPMSTVTSENGSWVLGLSAARKSDLSDYYTVDQEKDLLEISVQAGASGISSAQIYSKSAKPTPPIILGQVHDFKNLAASTTGENPSADLTLPESATKSSKFDVSGALGTATGSAVTTVTLTNIDEGEVVKSTNPQFIGEAPPGTKVTIKIESEVQTDTITVGSSGEWEWNPPKNLTPGEHTVTLSWKDAKGILKTLTKSFVVQAAEGPAFVASPSATIPASAPAVPVTATPLPTILLVIMGIALVTFGASVGYLAFEEK